MTNEQLEHALKVMYGEIVELKKQIQSMSEVLDMLYSTDEEGNTKRRDYWNIDNHINR